MSRNLAAFISLALVCSGSFALSIQSAEAKTSRNTFSGSRNYLVPPPPPYTPSMFPPALAMMNAQAATWDAQHGVVEKPASYNMPQAVQPSQYVGYTPIVDTKVLKQIDSFDSEISSHEKEIGKLLNL